MSIRSRRFALSLVATMLIAAVLPLIAEVGKDGSAEDWPQFRGVERDGVSPATGLLDSWPEAGPKELWRRPLGEGYSAISIAGDRLYTMYAGAAEGEDDKEVDYAAAFDAATGEEIWRTALGDKLTTEFGNGPRSTPTVDGDTVYVLDATGHFAALKAADGSKVWELDFAEAFGTRQPYWGYSTSALVAGDLLLVEAGGGEGKSYAGLDKATGEVRWMAGNATAGYNSPLQVELGGETVFVYVAGTQLVGLGTDGKERFAHEWPQGETHAMPVFLPPDRFFASGAGQIGGAMMRVVEKDGAWTVEEVWKNPLMRNHFGSSLVHDGYLYGFDNATFKCISAETGEQQWAKRGLGKGSLILADGDLLVLSDKGVLLLVEATAESYSEKGRAQALEGRSWTAPTLAGGRLYLRNHDEMVAYDLRG